MTTPTQLADKELLAEVQRLGGHKTKRETINEALKEYIRWRNQIEAIQHFGTMTGDIITFPCSSSSILNGRLCKSLRSQTSCQFIKIFPPENLTHFQVRSGLK
jgi:Bacterial antitoxin of type II TA system, VapB